MRLLTLSAMSGLLVVSKCLAQEPAPNPPQSPSQLQEQAPAVAAQKQAIMIPVGTRVPLTLSNPIRTKQARPGDAVRAVTAFPVVLGTQLVIPAGTFLEGKLDKVIKRGRSDRPNLQIHFTRIVFANGYAVVLEGATAEAKAGSPNTGFPGMPAQGSQGAASTALALQQPPPLPPLPPQPKIGPSIGTIAGVAVGVIAAAVVTAVVLGRHRGRDGDTLFDTGYQFEMVLQTPLFLDGANVAAAVAGTTAQ